MTTMEVCSIKTIVELQKLSWKDYADRRFERVMGRTEFEHIFRSCDACWLHDGDPAKPHAELTGGLCSNGFIDCLRVLKYSNLCQIMAEQILWLIRYHYDGPIHWVVGSDHAGAALSKDVANFLNAKHDFTEKGPNKTQLWKRHTIGEGEVVLQIEDLMTNADTFKAVRLGIREGNLNPVTFAPVAGVLVHRSGVKKIEGTDVIFLQHYEIQNWQPEDCPLCNQGSKRLRPKVKEHWAELTGKA